MWTVVYIAPNRPVAEMLREILEAEGIMASLRPIGVPHESEAAYVEIHVPKSEIEEAAEISNASFGS